MTANKERLRIGTILPVTRLVLLSVVFVGGAYARIYLGLLAWVPRLRQQRTLRQILRRHADTPAGRRLELGKIRSYEQFRAEVPVTKYEDIRAHVNASMESGANTLFAGDIYSVTSTSGTTGRPKFILLSRELFKKEFLLSTLNTLFLLLMRAPLSMLRPITIVAAASERYNRERVTHVSSAGELYRTSLFRHLVSVPREALEIHDWRAKYYYLCLFHLASGSTCILTPNPTTILEMLNVAQQCWSDLSADLEAVELPNRHQLEDSIFRALAAAHFLYGRRADRARRRVGAATDGFAARVRTVVTWTNGSCAVHAAQLQSMLRPDSRIINLGFLASDSPLLGHVGPGDRQILLLHRVFAEFVDVTAGENDATTEPVPYHALTVGREYRAILTNHYGLYRYDLEDIFRVTGRCGRSGILEFVRKAAGYSNITGEKLTEAQVIEAVMTIASQLRMTIPFFVAVPDVPRRRYILFLELGRAHLDVDPESLASALDAQLTRLNPEYATKRASGRLRVPALELLRPGALGEYRRAVLSRGGRDAQFKVMCLRNDESTRALLQDLVLRRRDSQSAVAS